MSVFADSSALVKLYADEVGADVVQGLSAVAVSQLARVEVPAALWRKQRMGELEATEAQALTAEFEADMFGDGVSPPRFAIVAVDSDVLDDAARLCAVHGLRACDAVQLASAIAGQSADGGLRTIAAFDRTLRGAASVEGFILVPAAID